MKKLIIIILFILICLTSSPAFADDIIKDKLSIFTQLYVKHFCNDSDLNEKNDIFGVVYNRFTYFTFNNSFRRRSYVFGYDLTNKVIARKDKFLQTKLHLYAGLLYGYGDSAILSSNGYRIVAAPTIELKLYKGLSTEGLYVPDRSGGTIISVIKYNF